MAGSRLIAVIAALAGLSAAVPATAQDAPQITWRVENPFRLFTDAQDTEIHRATFDALSEDERNQPVLSAERALAERHPDGWAATIFRKTCWDPQKVRHVCPEYADYINPTSHRVRAHVSDVPNADTTDCTWLTTPLGSNRRRGAAITVPCDTPVTLEIPYPAGARISVEVDRQQVAETRARVRDLFVVGMGDSFASGEGNPDVPVRFSRERTADYGLRSPGVKLDGYPARVGDWKQIGDKAFIAENAQWMDQACHRSLYSPQLRTALQLAVEDPHRAVTYVGVACSGAETIFGMFLRYKGNEWVPNPPLFSQISAIAEAQCGREPARDIDLPEAYHMNGRLADLQGGLVLKRCEPDKARKIDLLLLSIGGNDIGFARLVANAVLADSSVLRSLGGWFGQVHGFAEAQKGLETLDDRYKSLKRAFHNLLHIPWSEADRVVLTGYPPLALMEDGRSLCPDGQAGMTVLPDFQLSEAKTREGEVAAARMHDLMKTAARQHGWTFVESHRRLFQGRGLCAGYTENAFNSADDLRIPRLVDGRFEPFNPADWRAYAPRQRWFRTPNDAFMAGNFHASQSTLQSVLKSQGYSWVQLLLASTYSGSFHPSAEGHAATADAVVAQVRDVVRRPLPATQINRSRRAEAPSD